MKSTSSSAPQLQAPGAGLPLPQRLALKFWIGPVVSKRTSLEQTRKLYEGLTQKIIELVTKVPEAQRNLKVLIDPIAGLEDSSRYWSLNETLEHMLIVSRGTEPIILQLCSGIAPDIKVDLAKVKPKGALQNSLAEFREYAPGLMARLDEKMKAPGMSATSKKKHLHPWFGPITAHQWYWVLGSHQGIHYAQIKRIIKGLGNKN